MQIMDVLVRNLRLLMERAEFNSQEKVSRATGVSQTHIGNILRGEKTPGIDIIESLAGGLGVAPWQLLAPEDLLINGANANLSILLGAYLNSDTPGRRTILQVAEAQSQYTGGDQEN